MPTQDDKTRRKAVAVGYDPESDAAPRIIAKGQGLIADQIIEIARENDIHIHQDPEMAALLGQLDTNTAIPPELYQAVAEVLAFVFKLDKRFAPH